MKTVRLFFLLLWAFAQVLPQAAANPAEPIAAKLPKSGLPLAATKPVETPRRADAKSTGVLTHTAVEVSAAITQTALTQSQRVADVWRDFANEWLFSRKILWIGMFLLLLLLARL